MISPGDLAIGRIQTPFVLAIAMSDVNWGHLREQAIGAFDMGNMPPTVKLPALPLAVTRFMERSRDPKVDLLALARVVETDTGLTAELLKHINSAYFGLRQKVRTVQQGLALLGMRQSKLFVVTVGMQAAVRARQSKLLSQACFWNSSLQRAIFAREVARLLNTDLDIAFAGALLQDFLLPVLTNDLFDTYSDFATRRAEMPESLIDHEDASLGWNHAVAGGCIAYRWQLPDDLVCCVLYHHLGLRALADPNLSRSPVAAVCLSALLPDQLRQNFHGLEQLIRLQTKWPAFRLQSLVDQVDSLHEELSLGVENHFPLARRCRQVLNRSLQGDEDWADVPQEAAVAG